MKQDLLLILMSLIPAAAGCARGIEHRPIKAKDSAISSDVSGNQTTTGGGTSGTSGTVGDEKVEILSINA